MSCKVAIIEHYRRKWLDTSLNLLVVMLILPSTVGLVRIAQPRSDSVDVDMGMTIDIVCNSEQVVPLSWQHNGQTIERSEYIAIHDVSLNTSSSMLTLMQLDVDKQTGIYRCLNDNDLRDFDEIILSSASATKIAKTVDIISPLEDHITVQVGGEFTLKCLGEEHSDPIWLHNGVNLAGSARVVITKATDIQLKKRTLMLTIRGAESTQAGRYECQDNKRVMSSDSVRVTIAQYPSDRVPVAITEPKDIRHNILPGETFIIRCRSSIDTELSWYKSNRLISLLEKPYLTMTTIDENFKTSLLTIDKAKHSDEGRYQCRNQLDPNDLDSVHITVSHEVESPGSTPTQLRSMTLKVGDMLDLHCRLEGLGDHVVVWTKNNNAIPFNHETILTSPNELKILRTVREDAGLYACSFKQPDSGHVQGVIRFNITTALCPVILPPRNGTYDMCPDFPVYGESCHFRCNPGFHLTNFNPLVCEKDGRGYKWAGEMPLCTRNFFFNF